MSSDPAALLASSGPTDAARTSGLIGEIAAFWHQFVLAAFDPYRPEQHYMRGPGPACRAKIGKGPRGKTSA
jgi:hypothetical protein